MEATPHGSKVVLLLSNIFFYVVRALFTTRVSNWNFTIGGSPVAGNSTLSGFSNSGGFLLTTGEAGELVSGGGAMVFSRAGQALQLLVLLI